VLPLGFDLIAYARGAICQTASTIPRRSGDLADLSFVNLVAEAALA